MLIFSFIKSDIRDSSLVGHWLVEYPERFRGKVVVVDSSINPNSHEARMFREYLLQLWELRDELFYEICLN